VKKYRLDTNDTIQRDERTLYRIIALKYIPRYWVRPGDKGGYVESESNLAHAGDCWVGRGAKVSENARISGHVRVLGYAKVSGSVRLSGNVVVSGNAKLSENARLSGDVVVSGNSWIRGDTRLSGDARVSGDTRLGSGRWRRSPLQIQGSRHFVNQFSEFEVAVGCKVLHIDTWLQEYEAMGKAHRYTEDEIEEYGQILRFMKMRIEKMTTYKEED
jgi:NDP-sugar pyrophosphorylase family protein